MDNPIKYENLFDADVIKGVKDLENELNKLRDGLLKMIKDAKGSAKAIQDSTNPSKKKKEIEDLYEAYEKMGIEYQNIVSSINAVSKSQNELSISQKELNKVVKLGNEFQEGRGNTYNNLSKQYSAMKILIDNMTDAERDNTVAGKRMVEQSKRIYEQMNLMQQQTGKFQLQVGNYSKALGGLNIATQQVIREMPVLANGIQMFVMAIGNNIPILIDNIKMFKKEQEELAKQGQKTMSVAQAMIKTIFSWQTAIVVLLTVLPMIIRKINQKKKETEELADATKKNAKELSAWGRVLVSIGQEEARETTKIKTLTTIMDDQTRSWTDRLNAARELKETFSEELEAFSAEEIAVGKATEAIDRMNMSIKEQARARAIMNQITKLSEEQVETERMMEEKRGLVGVGIKDGAEYYSTIGDLHSEYQRYGAYAKKKYQTVEYDPTGKTVIKEEEKKVRRFDKATTKILEDYDKIYKKWDEAGENIDKLVDMLNPFYLLGDEKGGRGGRGSLDSMKDYYWDWRESIANIILDAENKEIELNDIAYEHEIQNRKDELAELKKTSNYSIEQEKYLTEIILNLETERQQKRVGIIHKFIDKLWKDISKDISTTPEGGSVGEGDFSLSGQYEKLIAEQSRLVIESRARLNEELKNGTYRSAREEGELFKELSREKLRIEADLQKALLTMRYETGELTKDQYDIEIANLETKLAKNIASFNRKRGKKFNFWSILFGEVSEDGKGNVKKELTPEMEAFTSSIEKSFNMAFDYMQKWMDMRIEMAHVAVESAQKEADFARQALDTEMEARANGYAHNVEYARKEYEEKMALKREAMAEEQRLANIQRKLDEAQQMSSLLVATANIWAQETMKPLGVVLAGIATASMWGSFAAAKIQASQLVKTKTYGEGMSEYLDYGGSHASGNDIDFGTMRDGTRRRVERGEMVAVINKKNVSKYGVGNVSDVIGSLNNGTFEDKYGLAFAGLTATNDGVDLSKVERGIDKIVAQGEKRVVQNGDTTIEYYRNRKRIIKN